jgi:hypothetical protein
MHKQELVVEAPLDSWDNLLETQAWAELMGDLKGRHSSTLSTLCRSNEHVEIFKAQGELRAIEYIFHYVQKKVDLLEEMRNA